MLATLGLLAACSSATDREATPGPSDPEPFADATVTVMQYTHDEVNRVLVVKVGNISVDDETVSLDSVQVLAPGFDGVGPVEMSVTVPPGREFDLRVPYGDPVCDGPEPTGEVVVRLGLPDAEGAEEVVSPKGSELLGQVREQECSAQRIQKAAPLRWAGDSWQRDGSGESAVVRGVLRVGPVAPGSDLRLVGVEDTVVFSATAPRLPLTLVEGQSLALDVTFEPARCDPHVLADSAQGFVFQARLRRPAAPSDGSEDVLAPVVPDAAAKNVLTDGWLEQCGFADR